MVSSRQTSCYINKFICDTATIADTRLSHRMNFLESMVNNFVAFSCDFILPVQSTNNENLSISCKDGLWFFKEWNFDKYWVFSSFNAVFENNILVCIGKIWFHSLVAVICNNILFHSRWFWGGLLWLMSIFMLTFSLTCLNINDFGCRNIFFNYSFDFNCLFRYQKIRDFHI